METNQRFEELKELFTTSIKEDDRHYTLIKNVIALGEAVTKDPEKYVSEEYYILQRDSENEDNAITKLYDEVEGEASGLFINSKGQASNYSVLRPLTNGLLWVGPGEVDSFGWLTGIVHTPFGKVVYG